MTKKNNAWKRRRQAKRDLNLKEKSTVKTSTRRLSHKIRKDSRGMPKSKHGFIGLAHLFD